MKDLKQSAGAHSSDYGLSREKLNSRCGTRQKSRFKISGSNSKALEKLNQDDEMQSKHAPSKTISDR